ncbi:MAG: hypothetical protein ACYTFA_12225 [Planctomycetota bacterium]
MLTASIAPAGCGMTMRSTSADRILFVSDCGDEIGAPSRSVDAVLLDWTGGTSPIYASQPFEGLDLAVFETAEGGTLADDAERFKELVRTQVARIYCDWPEATVIAVNGEDHQSADTIVHLTQEVRPNGTDIGEGEYDPCNRQNDNAAIVFGERLWQLGDAYTFDEWVTVFANVCAHEIGHTLGYGHISREERTDLGHTLFVELMLDRHTMAEMRRPQRFIADQTNCPDELAAKGRPVEAVFTTHGIAEVGGLD